MFWQPLLDWFHQQSIRDQKVLKIGIIAVVTGIFYFMMLKPYFVSQSQLNQQIVKAEKDLNWMIKQSESFQNAGAVIKNNSSLPVSQIVTQTAKKYALQLTRIQPKRNQNFGLWLDNVKFSSLVIWIQDFQNQGVQVESIDINKTESEGIVKATLTVSGSHS